MLEFFQQNFVFAALAAPEAAKRVRFWPESHKFRDTGCEQAQRPVRVAIFGSAHELDPGAYGCRQPVEKLFIQKAPGKGSSKARGDFVFPQKHLHRKWCFGNRHAVSRLSGFHAGFKEMRQLFVLPFAGFRIY